MMCANDPREHLPFTCPRMLTGPELRTFRRLAEGMTRGWRMDERGFLFAARPPVAADTPLFFEAIAEHNADLIRRNTRRLAAGGIVQNPGMTQW